MAFLKKLELTESAFGEGIKIWSVSTDFPMVLHTTSCGSKDIQELWLWAYNHLEADDANWGASGQTILYLEIHTSSKISDFCVKIPPSIDKGPTLVCAGIALKDGATVKAYGTSSDVTTVLGYVNLFDQTNISAELDGFGENTYGQANHPAIGGKNHEIKFDADGKSVACGNGFSLALRPNGSVFGWGGGNIVTELLNVGDNAPWKNNVDIYSTTDNLIVASNGVPTHDTPYKNIHAPNPGNNPHKALKQDHYFLVPHEEHITGTYSQSIPRGNIGVAIDGIPFDIRTAEVWSGMAVWEEVAGPGDLGADSCGGHVQPGGKYHYHINPSCLYQTNTGQHSPVIGYAFDGLPIYGPIGYTETSSSNGGVSVMASSYRLRQGNRPGPATGVGPGGPYDGTYTADYEYIEELGHLDRSNARFAVTPESPTGSWHYHATVTGITSNNPNGVSVYPYIIGPVFKGVPVQCNWNANCQRPVVFPPRNLRDIEKIEVGNNHALALTSSGKAIAWGDNEYAQCNVHTNLENGVVDISAGANHSLAIQAGQIISWGDNDLGQVSSSPSLRYVGEIQTLSSGENYSAAPIVSLAGGGTEAANATAEAVLAGRGILSLQLISGGAGFTESPDIVFAGGGGTGAAATATLTSDSNNPAYGYVSSLTITDSGDGYVSSPTVSFVDNGNSCTGYGICGAGAVAQAFIQNAPVSGFVVTSVGAGYSEAPSVSIVNDAGDTTGSGAAGIAILGGPRTGFAYPLEINDELVTGVQTVSAGIKHNVALRNGGTIALWGSNAVGQLVAPVLNITQESFTKAVAGGYHSMAVVSNTSENANYINAWGSNTYGQVNVPSTASLSSSAFGNGKLDIRAGLNHSLVLNPNATVTAFGASTFGQTSVDSIGTANSVIGGATSNHSFVTVNDIYTKDTLSSSMSGCGITVTDLAVDGSPCIDKTHIHRAKDLTAGMEELWMWAYNGGSATDTKLEIYLEPKETSSLFDIKILDSGAGYTQTPTIIISGGGGENAQAAAEISVDNIEDTLGYIHNIKVTVPGSGYKYPPAILITGGFDDINDLVPAQFSGVIETGEKITYTLPPKTSGLHLLTAGMKLEKSHNIRAAAINAAGAVPAGSDAVQIYGHVIRQEIGLEGGMTYHDSPYQIGTELNCPPITTLSSSAVAGQSALSVSNTQGFYSSQTVVVAPYLKNQQTATVSSVSSLILTTGLDTGHAANTWIVDEYHYLHGQVDIGYQGAGGSTPPGTGTTTTTTYDPYGGDPPLPTSTTTTSTTTTTMAP